MKKISNIFLIVLFLVLLFLDQVSKNLLFKRPINLGIFSITPITNTGMSFGLFQGNNTIFIIISMVFIALLLFFRKEFEDYKILLVMILAGAAGNLIDRIIHGHVLDFIDFRFFPVFNVADSLIFLGVVGIIFLEIKKEIKQHKIKKSKLKKVQK